MGDQDFYVIIQDIKERITNMQEFINTKMDLVTKNIVDNNIAHEEAQKKEFDKVWDEIRTLQDKPKQIRNTIFAWGAFLVSVIGVLTYLKTIGVIK